VVNFHDYLSDDPAIVSAVCEIMPPAKALVTLETTLTEEQRQGFKFVHKEDGRLDNSAVYRFWSRLKELMLQYEYNPVSVENAEASETHELVDAVLAADMDNLFALSQSCFSDILTDASGILEIVDQSAACTDVEQQSEIVLEQNLTYLSGNEQQFLAVNERDATILGSNTLQPVLQAVSE